MPKIVYHDSDGIDKSINVGAEPISIGRATECDIQTQDAMVSRKHARIVWDGNYWIEDLGSSNGVYVGNEKVQRAPFRPGDVVTCGSLVLRMIPDSSPRTAISPGAVAPTQAVDTRELQERRRIPTSPIPQPQTLSPMPNAPPPPAPPPPIAQTIAVEPEPPSPQAQRPTHFESFADADTAKPPGVKLQVSDVVILLSDALAGVRSSLRAANGEATLLKQPEESVDVVRDSLKSAAEQLEVARQHLRNLAKLLGV